MLLRLPLSPMLCWVKEEHGVLEPEGERG